MPGDGEGSRGAGAQSNVYLNTLTYSFLVWSHIRAMVQSTFITGCYITQSLISSSDPQLHLLLPEIVQERTESSGSGHLPRRGNMRSRIPSWSCMATAGERLSCSTVLIAHCRELLQQLWLSTGRRSLWGKIACTTQTY